MIKCSSEDARCRVASHESGWKHETALVGPRQTWRVAGPQDTTNEEWEFSEKFGVTLVHIEMEEIMEAAEKISEKRQRKYIPA